MTVAELIELLKGMPQALPVTVWSIGYDDEYCEVEPRDVTILSGPTPRFVRRPYRTEPIQGQPHVRIG